MVNVKDLICIQNVVASSSLDQKIDLNAVVTGIPGVEYDPKRFPGLIYKIKRPKSSILIFGTGKMVCTGTRSASDAIRAVNKVVNDLKNNGIVIVGKPKTEIVNIVSSGDLCGSIDLERAAYALKRTLYEPEQFPGLIYRMDEPKVVFLLFASGKIVCTGAKRQEDIYIAVEELYRDLVKNGLIE